MNAGMTDPFARLGATMVRWRRVVVAVWVVALIITGGLFAPRAASALKAGGIIAPDSESDIATRLLDEEFNASTFNNVAVVFRSSSMSVDDEGYKTEVGRAVEKLRAVEQVTSVISYIEVPDPRLIGSDRRSTVAVVTMDGDEGEVQELVPELREQLADLSIEHFVTGTPAINHDFVVTSEEDLARAELITLPIVIILLLLVFRTLVASAIPLILGATSVVLALSVLFIVGSQTDISIFAVNVATMIGLGIGVDFALIVVNRFREELAAGREVHDAVIVTMSTSGRSITYSGVTVLLGMLVLTLIVNLFVVSSMSLGVMLVAIASMLSGLTLLPALLAMIGHRIEWLRVIPRRKTPLAESEGFWYRMSHAIMRRPWRWLVASLIVLLLVAYPARSLAMIGSDPGVLPAEKESVEGVRILDENFGENRLTPIQIVMKADQENGIWTPAFLNSIKELTNVLATDPRTQEVTSLSTMLWNVPAFEYPNINKGYFRVAPVSDDPTDPFALPNVPGVTLETIISAEVDSLPHPPAFAGTGRFTIAPGQGVQGASAPAVDLIRVESGALSVQAHGEATLIRGVNGGVGAASEAAPIETRFGLNPGDQLVVPVNVPISLRNEGAQPASMLVVTVFVIRTSTDGQAGWTVGQPSADRFAGIERQVLSGGVVVDLPRGRAKIQMDRAVAAPGAFFMRHTHTGPETFYVESGEFTVFTSDQMTFLGANGEIEDGLPYDVPFPLGPGGKVLVQGRGIHRGINNSNADVVLYSTRIYDANFPPVVPIGAAQEASQYVNIGGSNDTAVITVISNFGQYEDQHQALIADLRENIVPEILNNGDGFEIFVGGSAASFIDFRDALYGRFPWLVLAVLAMTFLILMMFFQSVFLPLKAIFMNLVSILATYGVLVMIFQYGWGSAIFGFDSLGAISVVTPAILFVILIGLSTDYEVFMLSRVREYYHQTGNNEESVASGLQHTGGVITAAGLLLIGVFGSFAAAGIITIKEIGIGLAVGILIDTTIVRVIMVPSTMRLMGAWNWWMPSWLKRIVPELREGAPGPIEAAPGGGTAGTSNDSE